MKRLFKIWYDKQCKKVIPQSEGLNPSYLTYRDKNYTYRDCRVIGRKLDAYCNENTYLAWKAFEAGLKLGKELQKEPK